jgi:hypothetical protein
MHMVPVSATPIHSSRLAWSPSHRVSPRQAPSPRVAPRMNPMDVSSPRVNHTLPITSVINPTPHQAAENSPYAAPQGMAGIALYRVGN